MRLSAPSVVWLLLGRAAGLLPAASSFQVQIRETEYVPREELVEVPIRFNRGELKELRSWRAGAASAQARVLSRFPGDETIRAAFFHFPVRMRAGETLAVELRESAGRPKTSLLTQSGAGFEVSQDHFRTRLLDDGTAVIESDAGFTAKIRFSGLTLSHPLAGEVVENGPYCGWVVWKSRAGEWCLRLEHKLFSDGRLDLIARLRRIGPDAPAPEFGFETTLSGNIDEIQFGSRAVKGIGAGETERLPLRELNNFSTARSGRQQWLFYYPYGRELARGAVEWSRQVGTAVHRYFRIFNERRVVQEGQEITARLIISAGTVDTAASRLASLRAPLRPRVAAAQRDWGPLERFRRHLTSHIEIFVEKEGDESGNWYNVATSLPVPVEQTVVPNPLFFNRYDMAQSLWADYLKGGSPRLRELALLALTNTAEMTIYRGPNQEFYGYTRYPGSEPGLRGQPCSFCFKGSAGMVTAYEETGDSYFLETAREMTDSLVRTGVSYVRGRSRNQYYLKDLIEMYAYTGEKKYLDTARAFFEHLGSHLDSNGLIAEEEMPDPPENVNLSAMDCGDCYKAHIFSYILAGVSAYATETKNPRAIRAVKDFAGYLVRSQLRSGAWKYPQGNSIRPTFVISSQVAQALLSAYEVVPEPAYLRAAEKAIHLEVQFLEQQGYIPSGAMPAGFQLSGVRRRRRRLEEVPVPERRYYFPRPWFNFNEELCRLDRDSNSYAALGVFGVITKYLRHRPAAEMVRFLDPTPETRLLTDRVTPADADRERSFDRVMAEVEEVLIKLPKEQQLPAYQQVAEVLKDTIWERQASLPGGGLAALFRSLKGPSAYVGVLIGARALPVTLPGGLEAKDLLGRPVRFPIVGDPSPRASVILLTGKNVEQSKIW